jgi:hypothetical protein
MAGLHLARTELTRRLLSPPHVSQLHPSLPKEFTMKTTSILLVAAMFAASGMAVAATQDTAKPAAVPTTAMAPAAAHHHRHHKHHKHHKVSKAHKARDAREAHKAHEAHEARDAHEAHDAKAAAASSMPAPAMAPGMAMAPAKAAPAKAAPAKAPAKTK